MIAQKITKVRTFVDYVANPAREIEVFGMFGSGNLGDEAMLVAARTVLGHDRTLSWQSYANPLLNRAALQRRRKQLLVAGGTLIHGGETGWLDFVEHRHRQGSRVTFFGTGMNFTEAQIRTPSDEWRRWSVILSASDTVCLRGPASVEMARDMGASAEVFGDFALLLHDPALCLAPTEAREDVIGLNFGDCLGDQEAFEASSAALVRHLHGRHRLVFHAVVDKDVPVIHRIARLAGLTEEELVLERHFFDPLAFMRSIRRYRAFFALKLHAAGLAMVAGVPSLMVAYQPKARDFMAPLGGREDLIVDLPMQVDTVIAQMEQLLARPHDADLTARIAEISVRQKARLVAAFPRG